MPSPIADSVDCCRKLSVGLPLKVLTHVAYKGPGLRGCVHPDSVLVEDFEGRNIVLKNECEPLST